MNHDLDDDDDEDRGYILAKNKFLEDCAEKREKVLKHVDDLEHLCNGMKLKSVLYKILVDFQTNVKEHNRDSNLKFYSLVNNN